MHKHLHDNTLNSPLLSLRRAALTLRRTVERRLATSHSADVIHLLNWQPLDDLLRRFDHWLVQGPDTSPLLSLQQVPLRHAFQCILCDFSTDNIATLRRHYTDSHGMWMVRSRHVKIADFALHGMPQCKHCHQTFTSWRTFWTHIQRGCQALHPGPDPLQRRQLRGSGHTLNRSIAIANMNHQPDRAVRGSQMLTDDDLQVIRGQTWGTELLTIVTDREFHRLRHAQDACRYLTEFCCLCGLHVGRLQSMNLHLRTFHADYWNFVTSKSVQLSNLHSTESPCCCCGAIFRSQHTCPVWTQVAILLLYGGGLEGHSATPAPHSPLRCELCHELFVDTTALTGHLHAAHGLVATQWNQSRDSIDNSPACAHCGSVYTSMTGLRSHISQGRCPMYNPEATPETLPIQAQWLRFCINGKMLELYRDPMAKLKLTLHCQCCDRRFQRSMDLSPAFADGPRRHLASSSGHHWNVSCSFVLKTWLCLQPEHINATGTTCLCALQAACNAVSSTDGCSH